LKASLTRGSCAGLKKNAVIGLRVPTGRELKPMLLVLVIRLREIDKNLHSCFNFNSQYNQNQLNEEKIRTMESNNNNGPECRTVEEEKKKTK